jgi:O-acetyl-ADP-ribose deacetylase (regulator of RNase III)
MMASFISLCYSGTNKRLKGQKSKANNEMRLTVCINDHEKFLNHQHDFDGVANIEIVCGDIFMQRSDCFVTAGNSNGAMCHGLAADVNYFFGNTQQRVQNKITKQWRGELPVGAAVVISTPHNVQFKHLCYAPTMRTPINVASSINAYLAARGALVECSKYADIRSVVMPLLCGGCGGMETGNILHQIKMAYKSLELPTMLDWFGTAQILAL